MLAEAEKYADEDKEAAERVAAKNAVEGYCYSLKQTLSENGDKFDSADKETLQTKVDEAISGMFSLFLHDHPLTSQHSTPWRQQPSLSSRRCRRSSSR